MSERAKLDTIQALRALAALLVVMSHCQQEIYQTYKLVRPDSWGFNIMGRFGVDIFFVISGFIMMYVGSDLPGRRNAASGFLLKRIIRIAPMYWLATLLTIVASLVVASQRNNNDLRLDYLLSSFAFIPYVRDDGHFLPPLGVGWTLNYEFFFYFIFALMLFAPKRYFLPGISLFFVCLVSVGMLDDRLNPQIWFWSRPIILEFLLGMIIAHLQIRGVRLGIRLSLAVGAAGFLWWAASGFAVADPSGTDIRILTFGIPAAFIVGAAALSSKSLVAAFPARVSRALVMAGDASYSLYLFHLFVLRLVTVALPKHSFGPVVYGLIYYVVAIVASIAVALAIYRFVENPSGAFLRELLARFTDRKADGSARPAR